MLWILTQCISFKCCNVVSVTSELFKSTNSSCDDVLYSDSNTASTRRSSRVAAAAASDASYASSRRHRDSVISTLLRQEIERRKSLKDAADGPGVADHLLPVTSAAFELPGIHISRIETMDFDDDELSAGSR